MKSTPQRQFLQHIDCCRPDFCELHLSDYNFHKVRKLSQVSKLRWVKGTDLKLAPGLGSGTITIGKETFAVTYAWGGRNKPNSNERTSYTVRVTGPNCQERMKGLLAAIVTDETGSYRRRVPVKKYWASLGIRSSAEFRKRTLALSKSRPLYGAKPWSRPAIDRMVAEFEKQWTTRGAVVELTKPMKNIETDMLR